MVEFAIKALTKSALATLPQEWHRSQANIAKGILPDDVSEQQLRGHFLVWTNVMERLVTGVFAEDSDKAFVDWLADYRRHLEKALASEDGKGNPYIRGQVDAYNVYLRSYAEISKAGNKVYQEKIRKIKEKREELESLQTELDNCLFAFEEN